MQQYLIVELYPGQKRVPRFFQGVLHVPVYGYTFFHYRLPLGTRTTYSDVYGHKISTVEGGYRYIACATI